MSHCILCFNLLNEKEGLQVDKCFTNSESARGIIEQLFSFSNIIVNMRNEEELVICQSCWIHLQTVQEFRSMVSKNYEIENEGETVEKHYIKIEEALFEECFDNSDEYAEKSSEVEALDEVNIVEKSVIPVSIREPAAEKSRTQSANRTSDDDKVRMIADLTCELCSSSLDSFSDALSHYRTVHHIPGYMKCCGRKFRQRYRLVDHVNSHFNIVHECEICKKQFDTRQYLNRHKIYHQEKKDYECDCCGKTFARKFLLRNHLTSVHIYENVAPTFACNYEGCGKVYVNEHRLKHHIKYTHSTDIYEICEICSKTFTKKASFADHMKTHFRKPEDRFKCEICGHFISDKRTFRKHVKNHETEGLDNICTYCGKKSPNLIALKRHVKYMHETLPKHECRFCGKKFKRTRDIIDHEASVHTLVAIYECNFCSKTFRNQSNMLSHRKKKHPDLYEKPFYMK